MTIYDLLLKNATLIDPAQGIDGVMDVAFANGRVAALEKALPAGRAARTMDCGGYYLVPGLIDLHAHAYWGVSHYGLENPDACCVARGATTILDTGSAGADTFPGFRRYVIEPF